MEMDMVEVMEIVYDRKNNHIRFFSFDIGLSYWDLHDDGVVARFIKEPVNLAVDFYFPLYKRVIDGSRERFSGVSGFDRYLVTEGVLNEL
jgi:hypothetical protein